MADKTSVIFGNQIDKKTIKQAEKSKAKFIKKYGLEEFNKIAKANFANYKDLITSSK